MSKSKTNPKDLVSTKLDLYEYCRGHKEHGTLWPDIYLMAKKDRLISAKTTYPELLKLYQTISGEVETFGSVKETSFDEDVEEFHKWIGRTRSILLEKETYKAQDVVTGNRTKTLIVSDLHIPYLEEEKFLKIIDEHASPETTLVILGDFLNGHSLSDHMKLTVDDFREEMKKGRLKLEFLAPRFKNIIMTDDNHVGSRFTRLLGYKIPADLHFLVQHPYDLLCAGLPNVQRSSEVLKSEFAKDLGWLYVLGKDCVMSHAETSGVDFDAARRVQKWAGLWKKTLGIKEVRCVVQAHTHQSGTYHDPDCVLILSGCLVTLEGVVYSMSARCSGGPPKNGYAVVYQDDGVTDLEASQSFRLL